LLRYGVALVQLPGSITERNENQGCQISIDATYQSRKIYQMTTTCRKIAIKYTNIFYSKVLPKLVFWYGIIPSGNPDENVLPRVAYSAEDLHCNYFRELELDGAQHLWHQLLIISFSSSLFNRAAVA
jgi:hypothetical protein